MKWSASSPALSVCIFVLYLLVSAGGSVWTFTVEVSGMSANASCADAAVTFRNLELPDSLLTISIYPWKNKLSEQTAQTEQTGPVYYVDSDVLTLPKTDFLLISGENLTPSAGALDFSGFLSCYSKPGENLLFKDLDKESFKLSSAESIEETAVLLPFTFGFGASESSRSSVWRSFTGHIYAGSQFRHAGIELRGEFQNGQFGWNMDVSRIGAVSRLSGMKTVKAADHLVHEDRTELPFILYHSTWVSASVPSLRFFFGTGRRESTADPGEQWFVLSAGITELNVRADGGIYIAPRGLTDYDCRRNPAVFAGEAEVSADFSEYCTWTFDWNYDFQSGMPWNTLHTVPGHIAWESVIELSGRDGQETENELHIGYSEEYASEYGSCSKDSLKVDKRQLMTLRIAMYGIKEMNGGSDSSDRSDSGSSEDSCSFSAKSTAVLDAAGLLRDERCRSFGFPGIEEFRQTAKLKKVFSRSGITVGISLKYVYDCISRTMKSASSAFEIAEEFSWGTLRASLRDLNTVELSCSFSCRCDEEQSSPGSSRP